MPSDGRDKSRQQSCDDDEADHPIETGAPVTIIQAAGTQSEGHAVIAGVAPGRDRYWVRFTGDPVARERLVLPGTADDSDRTCTPAALHQPPHGGDAEAPIISDFFDEC